MRTTTVLASIFVMVPVSAAAAPHRELVPAETAGLYDLVASERTRDDIQFVRQLLPATTGTAALAQSRIVYLNRTGVTVVPGNNDARINRSSIVNQQSTVPAWNTSAETWAATVACMQDLFARFDVVLTDQDPGNVPHLEAVFGGSPQNIGMPSGGPCSVASKPAPRLSSLLAAGPGLLAVVAVAGGPEAGVLLPGP